MKWSQILPWIENICFLAWIAMLIALFDGNFDQFHGRIIAWFMTFFLISYIIFRNWEGLKQAYQWGFTIGRLKKLGYYDKPIPGSSQEQFHGTKVRGSKHD